MTYKILNETEFISRKKNKETQRYEIEKLNADNNECDTYRFFLVIFDI